MKYFDNGKMIYVTDLGSGGRVWTAIYAESGQPVPGIGTHRTEGDAEQVLYEMAEKRGWWTQPNKKRNKLWRSK